MSFNRRQLQKDTKELNKAKAPAKPRDVIYDPRGQWAFPGQETRIPGSDITMQGVDYPVYGVPNVGQPQMMQPGADYTFPGADYVDEYPQMKKGGRPKGLVPMPKPSKKGLASKAYSRSLEATNKLFTENYLFKKPKDKKRKVFDPNAKYYQDGGEYGMPLGTGVSQNFIGNRDEFKIGGIPELPLRDNRVNYNAFVNGFEPMSKKQKGGEPDYLELELTPEEIEEYKKGGYIVEDISVPSLNNYQDGGEETNPPADGVAQRVQYAEGQTPEGFAEGMPVYSEVTKKAEAPYWVKASREYESKNSKQAFIDKKKRDYLKNTNRGLSKAAGLSMENFPEDVERNFEAEYEYKKNNYVGKKLAKHKGFNIKRRGEWVDDLTEGEKNVIADSKYESKLQPGLWDKTLAGLVTLTTPFSAQANDAMNRGELPGLTKKEQREIKDSKMFGMPTGGLEALAGWDALGVAAANALEQSGNSSYGAGYREAPSALSGQPMANVKPQQAMVLNPLNYTLPYDVLAAAPSLVKGAKNVADVTKVVGQNLTKATPLRNAYKINPWAFKANPEAAYRMLGGKEGYLDAVESGVLRPNQKTGRYDSTFYNVGEPLDRYKAGYDTQYMAEVPLSNEKIYPRFDGDDYRISEELGTEAFENRVPKGHVSINDPGVNLYKEHWLQGYKKVKKPKATKKLEVVPSEEELIDLWRIQEKGDRPMAELAAEGKLGPMFKNEKAIQHFKDREKYFGQWFTKDKADLDWYKTDREFKDPEIINLKIPKSKLEEFQNYDKTLSRASDREFVIPHEQQGLYKVSKTPKELPGSSNKSFMGKVKDYFDRPPGPLMLGMPKPLTNEIKNPDYFTDLMKINKYSPKQKKYFEGIIKAVKEQGNKATQKQYDELQRLKTGDMNYGKKGYAKGGIVSELSKKEIKDLVSQGYIVEEVD